MYIHVYVCIRARARTHTHRVGTVTYMSPERLKGESYTFNADVWALGVIVVEATLGRCVCVCVCGVGVCISVCVCVCVLPSHLVPVCVHVCLAKRGLYTTNFEFNGSC
jgi:hypothetical protein